MTTEAAARSMALPKVGTGLGFHRVRRWAGDGALAHSRDRGTDAVVPAVGIGGRCDVTRAGPGLSPPQ